MTKLRLFSLFLVATCALCLDSCNKGPSLVKGDKLKDYLPKSAGNLKVIVTTEQKGFAQASLTSGEEEIATLAITDLVRDQQAAKKFEGAEKQVSGYPAIARGDAGTAVLAGRFQVQARSKIAEFSEAERIKWLTNCNLSGLAALK
ncbi:MAG: hypothetical protein P1V20_23375 [Verrucomicrobiales bacterium]|nr:hypothetical protein [Verrucomicrobiales bacterium]